MSPDKGYKLVPSAVPARQRASFYKQIIDDFIASNERSVLVDVPNRKSVTLVQGLRKVIESEALDDVKVIQRQNETYLMRE